MEQISKFINQIPVDKFKITPHQWKVFFINMGLIFLMVILQHLHLKTPEFFQALISPLPEKVEVLDQLLPKLEQKQNHYQLRKPPSFIPEAMAGQPFDQASAYGVIDFDSGEVLTEKNLERRLAIASITKLMSAVVTLDLLPPDQLLTVNQHDTQIEPTKLAMIQGEKYTVEELLSAALLSSANDAIEMLKEAVDQQFGEGSFIKAMNEKAYFLGMKNTQYANPQGLDNGHPFSSIEDQAILANYAITNYPLIKQIVSQDHSELPADNYHHYEYLNNWNGLIGVYPGTFGIKIGNTDEAGKTTVVVSQRADKKLLVIVLGAPGVLERDLYAASLLDLGFEKKGLEPIKISEKQLRVRYATWRQ